MCNVAHICSGAYASNVESMDTSTLGHITVCMQFIKGIYTDIVVSYVYLMKLAYMWY